MAWGDAISPKQEVPAAIEKSLRLVVCLGQPTIRVSEARFPVTRMPGLEWASTRLDGPCLISSLQADQTAQIQIPPRST